VSSSFAVRTPAELAFVRNAIFAVEILDAVTLEPVTRGIKVSAIGLRRKPIVNYSGAFVWLEEGNARPQQIVVDASNTPYESLALPAPAGNLMRVELAPRVDYLFGFCNTALRGTVIENLTDNPAVPVSDAEIWLQWIDDNAPGTIWIDAPTRSHSRADGDFAAYLRLTPKQVPRTDAIGVRSRLRVRRGASSRSSAEFSLPTGRVADALPAFGWSELQP